MSEVKRQIKQAFSHHKTIDVDGIYTEEYDAFLTGTGQFLQNVHKRENCIPPCAIHAPSDHHMRHMRLHWRSDLNVFERICEHGIGHPDPDSGLKNGAHGCDGCCSEARANNE